MKLNQWKKCLCFLLVIAMGVFAVTACSQPAAAPSAAAPASSEVKSESPAAASSSAAAESSQAAAADPDKYKFAVVKGGVHPYFNPMDQAVKDASKDLGIPEPVFQAPQNWNQNEQNNILDGLVAQGVKAIAMCTSDAVAGNEQISKIVENNIPVITFAMSPAQPTKSTFCLATDVANSAYLGTKHLIESMGGKGSIVHLTGNLTDGNTKLRMDAVEKAVKEFPDVKIVQTITDIDVAEPAQNAVSSLMAAKRNEIDGIICTAYIPAVTVASELRKLNDTRIKLVGIDTDEILLKAIKDGFAVGTMAQNPYGQAYISIYSMKLMADGYTWKKDAPFLIDSGTLFIDKSNVDTYQQDITKLTKDMLSDWTEKYFDKK
jgi:ribose transport system substrate-binding protein